MVDHQRSTHQHGLDLDVVDVEGGEEDGEEEDTRLARAFLMGTSEIAFGGANSVSFQMFHSPRIFPQGLRPQRSEE